jgi:RNA 2',3'-cyclic 3'-phosphodiesterase
MRLFVALAPPAAVLGDLDMAIAPHRAARPDLRWTGRPDWHVTLTFLGDVPTPAVLRLASELERDAARHPPLPLAFAGAGAFPAAVRAKVLWCGLTGGHGAMAGLADLAASVAAAAARSGAGPADAGRPFRPHLTLARCRTPADVRAQVAALGPYEGPPWRADRVHLVRSRPGGQPRYAAVGSWSLGGDTLGP